ncbi:GntR family transcriptional regulator [Nonomuraea mesophila]|uniref:GntR family transcriptional regulator n=1 Tax=Nonomuraea mesophila TaxID=2530382 RepID=A0A4R5F7H5_9ACTN|nr:GntR family transcriptional regulator [Nonomuraea mesophila]TDE44095.1 GntR family transcriptional regulator [Nonomuraea mesophila]
MTDHDEFAWDQTLYKYEQIAQVIAERIRKDVYPPQSVLSEVRFEDEFGVSRPTVRLAFKLLREEGLIVTRRGKGSVVVHKDHRPPR